MHSGCVWVYVCIGLSVCVYMCVYMYMCDGHVLGVVNVKDSLFLIRAQSQLEWLTGWQSCVLA